MRKLLLSLIVAGASGFGLQSFAIEGLSIQPQNGNILLTWPSSASETYIVQYRDALDSTNLWQTLDVVFGNDGTTTYTDYDRVPQAAGMQSVTSLSLQPMTLALSVGGNDLLEAILPPIPPLPPCPWDESTWTRTGVTPPISTDGMQIAEVSGPPPMPITGTNSGPSTPPTHRFYQIVRDGVHIVGLTNLTSITTNVSGAFYLTNELGNLDGYLSSVYVMVDGKKCSGSLVVSYPFSYPVVVGVDTAFLENGPHTFQVAATWVTDSNGQNDSIERFSESFSLSVSNSVYYSNWEELVGKGVSAFFINTVQPSATVELDIYDVNGASVTNLVGHATNGLVEIFWNLKDKNGILRTNASVDPVFYSQTTVTSGQSAVTSPNPVKVQLIDDWPDQGGWAVAYQDIFKYSWSQNNDMLNTLNSIGSTAAMHGGAYATVPTPGQSNYSQTWPIRYINANHLDEGVTQLQVNRDLLLLRATLSWTNIRNFVYVGHGGASSIAGFSTADYKRAIKHRYRFVFLTACETALGDADTAFHINGPGEYPISHYTKTGLRPALFCGYDRQPFWSRDTPVYKNGQRYDGEIPWQVPGFITNFLMYWHFYGYGAYDAFAHARWTVGDVTGWALERQPGERLRLYGYADMTVDSYNFKSDW